MVRSLAQEVGVREACQALDLPRATFYRHKRPPEVVPERRPSSPRALRKEERLEVLGILHSDRFVDQTPYEVYATLLDEGSYLCSVSTMYRILAQGGEVRERRNQLSHPVYQKPELLACAPNQVWSWDISRLKGPVKWNWFYLYVILDIFSRYVVGWMVAYREAAFLAQRLIQESCGKQDIGPDSLTIHSDRGSSMTSKGVAQLLADLGVTKSLSRPHISNDNPFSEAQFKTLKYRPRFPDRFGCIQDARAFCQNFFDWYNFNHRHSGIGFMTPYRVHYGKAGELQEQRSRVLFAAYQAHPERFVREVPQPPALPSAVWINPPQGGHEHSDGSTLNSN